MNLKFEKRNPGKRDGRLLLELLLGVVILLGGLPRKGEAAVVITPTQEVVMSGSGLNLVIADGGAVTVGETLSGYVHLPGNRYEISVSFSIRPDVTQVDVNKRYMVSGDYRVFLRHGSGVMTPDTIGSYLLKNVGQEYVFPQLGYWDGAGMDVTLEDSAAHSIQGYRSVLVGDHMTEITGVVGGTWRPLEALGSLGVGDPNGVWGLVFDDGILGGQANLQSWSVSLKPVPEPSAASCLVVALGLGLRRRRERNAV